jgi:hypothetical protein
VEDEVILVVFLMVTDLHRGTSIFRLVYIHLCCIAFYSSSDGFRYLPKCLSLIMVSNHGFLTTGGYSRAK